MNQAYNALMAEARRLKGACDALIEEKRRLRALNTKMLVALESLLRWAETSEATKAEGKAEHDDVVKGRARAALAEARAQQPPHGFVAGRA